jgi:hypothetical protein
VAMHGASINEWEGDVMREIRTGQVATVSVIRQSIDVWG